MQSEGELQSYGKDHFLIVCAPNERAAYVAGMADTLIALGLGDEYILDYCLKAGVTVKDLGEAKDWMQKHSTVDPTTAH